MLGYTPNRDMGLESHLEGLILDSRPHMGFDWHLTTRRGLHVKLQTFVFAFALRKPVAVYTHSHGYNSTPEFSLVFPY